MLRDNRPHPASQSGPSPRPDPIPADDLRRFTSLYRVWWGVVRDAADDVLASRQAGEDAAQRVFMKLWRGGGWRDVHDAARFFHEAGRREGLKMLYRSRRRRALLARRGVPVEWLSRSPPPTAPCFAPSGRHRYVTCSVICRHAVA